MSEKFEIVIIKDKKFDKSNCAVIVPKSYVTNNAQLQSCTRYLPPPYTEDDIGTINSFVLSRSAPPDSWGSYKCERKADAGQKINFK